MNPISSVASAAQTAPLAPRAALLGLALTNMLASLGTSIANVGLPTLAEAFGASFQAVQWIVLAYLLTITTFVVSAGHLGDWMGRRRLLLSGIILFTLASAACAMAPTLELMIAARVLQGLGAASLMGLTMAFVGDAVPPAQTGRAMGLLATLSAVGTALGPALGGVLIDAFGWPALFSSMIPLGLLALGLTGRFLPTPALPPPSQRPSFDFWGSLTLALALATYALSATLGGGPTTGLGFGLLLAALAIGGLFVWIEGRAAAPLLQFDALPKGSVARLAANALVSAIMMTTLVVGPFYLGIGLGLPAASLGLVLAAGPILSILTGVWAGRTVDRLGPGRVGALGLGLMIVGSLGLALLPASLGVPGYLAALAVLTPGYQFFQAACNTQVVGDAPIARRGVVSALLSLSRNLGLITGASLMGAVFVRAVGVAEIASASAPAVTEGMHLTFGIAALGSVAALLLWGFGLSRDTRRKIYFFR